MNQLLQDLKNSFTSVYIYSNGLYSNLHIKKLFKPLKWLKKNHSLTEEEKKSGFILIWGEKDYDKRKLNKEAIFVSIEDGFIRSVGLAKKGAPSHSYVLDYNSYYNAKISTQLEMLLNDYNVNEKQKQQATNLIQKIKEYNISKYYFSKFANNKYLLNFNPCSQKASKKVLVALQVEGDLSLTYGNAANISDEQLVEFAINKYSKAEIYVKSHPDSSYNYIDNATKTFTINEMINSISLIKLFDVIITRTSLIGMEALILGKKVHCFGSPFYAHWGLTVDHQLCKRRKRKLDIETLFFISYILYPIYTNPRKYKISSISDVTEYFINCQSQILWLGFSRKEKKSIKLGKKKSETYHFINKDKISTKLKHLIMNQAHIYAIENCPFKNIIHLARTYDITVKYIPKSKFIK